MTFKGGFERGEQRGVNEKVMVNKSFFEFSAKFHEKKLEEDQTLRWRAVR